jgi:hypothetical protein
MGHGPADIGPGTFYGGGNYIFPASSNVNVQGGLTVGGSLNSASIGVTGNLTVGDAINANKITANSITANSIKIVCPSGFTSIESQGRQLGCMQNAHQGNAIWDTANNDCFTTYGGRLPFAAEWYVAMANYNLQGETDGWEWVAEQHDGYHNLIGNANLGDNSYGGDTSLYAYRCWIPS